MITTIQDSRRKAGLVACTCISITQEPEATDCGFKASKRMLSSRPLRLHSKTLSFKKASKSEIVWRMHFSTDLVFVVAIVLLNKGQSQWWNSLLPHCWLNAPFIRPCQRELQLYIICNYNMGHMEKWWREGKRQQTETRTWGVAATQEQSTRSLCPTLWDSHNSRRACDCISWLLSKQTIRFSAGLRLSRVARTHLQEGVLLGV